MFEDLIQHRCISINTMMMIIYYMNNIKCAIKNTVEKAVRQFDLLALWRGKYAS
jgi:hypothetical protein